MGLSHSPSIVTSGLVFALDSANYKSFKGPVIQNKAPAIVGSTGSGTGYAISNATETYNIPELGSTSVVTTTIQNNYTSYIPNSTQCCPILASWVSISVSPSTLYTYGIVYRCDSGYTSANYMYRYEYTGSGGTYVTEGGVHSEARRVHLGNGWYYAWGTFTTQATTNWLATCGAFYYRYSQTSDRLSIAKVMIVQGDYSGMHPKYWPAQSATRSNTQALLDMTNNKTITATSLTYASDGSFTFNGSSDYATADDLGTLSTMTCEAIVKITSMPSGTQPCFITNVYPGTASRVNFALGFVQNPSSLSFGIFDGAWYYSPTFTPSTNTWYHVCGSYNGSVLSLYINGLLIGTPTSYAGPATTSNGGIRFGRRWDAAEYFNGNISTAKIYNRALTATEVQQNFNALRGRYGI